MPPQHAIWLSGPYQLHEKGGTGRRAKEGKAGGLLEEFKLTGILKFGEAIYVYTGDFEGASGLKFGPEFEREFLIFGLAFEKPGGSSECWEASTGLRFTR